MAGGNNIAVSITADVADLTAKMALAKVAVSDTTKEMTRLAKASGGEMSPQLLAAADAASRAQSSFAILGRQARTMAKEAETVGPALAGVQHGSAGVTSELLVMGRELSRGNFNRMAGSATILAGRLGVLTPTVLMTAGAIALLAAPLIAFGAASYLGAEQVTKMQNALKLTGGYAGVTISQLQDLSKQLSQSTNTSIGSATETMTKLAASGRFTGQELLLVGKNATIMGQLTGESAEKFIEEFEKMGGGVAKFAQEYQEQYHQLTTAQVEYIRTLEEQGRKEEAEYQLAKDVYDYLGKQAPENLGYLESAWRSLTTAVSGAWDAMKAVGRNTNQDQINALNQHIADLKNGKGSGYSTGLDSQAEIAAAEKQLKIVQDREKSQQAAAKVAADNARTQTEGAKAAGQLAEKFEASKTSGEKLKKALSDINTEMNAAIKADPGGRAKYEAEAAAARAQAEKSDTPHEKKGPKGPSVVSEWTEQLRAQQIAAKDYYSDQAADELKFWQSKVGLTAAGSKDWLEVQSHIYEASKSLARQSYQDKIADLNEALAADRNNWTKEQADWQTKLAYIRSTFSEQSTEYKNAYREMERSQQDHDAKELRETEEHIKKQTEELKRSLSTQAKAREDDAKAAESIVKADAGSSPFGEIAAQHQLAQIHSQVTQQQIADNETLHASETSALDAAITAAAAKYNGDKTQYQSLIDAKMQADRQYADKKQELDAKLREQSIQDILAMRAAYQSYISSTVSTTVSGLDKMISGQMTWRQFGVSIYQSVAREAEQQVTKMATNWLVQHVLMSAAQKAQLAAQTAAQATAMTSQTAITLASSKAQVVALAGLAGAGGVASMAAAPWPLDMTAPAFGAQMAASAMAMGSFAQGANIVPNDMIAQVHAGERIIPKADNDRLIQMTAAGAAGGGTGGGGTMHNHFSPTIHANGVDGKAVMAAIEGNFGDFTSLLKRAARNGVFR